MCGEDREGLRSACSARHSKDRSVATPRGAPPRDATQGVDVARSRDAQRRTAPQGPRDGRQGLPAQCIATRGQGHATPRNARRRTARTTSRAAGLRAATRRVARSNATPRHARRGQGRSCACRRYARPSLAALSKDSPTPGGAALRAVWPSTARAWTGIDTPRDAGRSKDPDTQRRERHGGAQQGRRRARRRPAWCCPARSRRRGGDCLLIHPGVILRPEVA